MSHEPCPLAYAFYAICFALVEKAKEDYLKA